MPLFEFQCSDCGEISELLVSKSDVDPECRSCGSPKLKKILSVPSSLSGVGKPAMTGVNVPCCGVGPDEVGCPGPGSCCGKTMG